MTTLSGPVALQGYSPIQVKAAASVRQDYIATALQAYSQGLLTLRYVKDGWIGTVARAEEIAPLIDAGFKVIYNTAQGRFFLTRGLQGGTLEEIAKTLIDKGWKGDEDELEMGGTKKAPVYTYKGCSFAVKDLDSIREIVQILVGASAPSGQEGSGTYESVLEQLRNHLINIQNPFLVQKIVAKLGSIDESTWLDEVKLKQALIEAEWPFETRQNFMNYCTQVYKKVLQARLNNNGPFIEKMKVEFLLVVKEAEKRANEHMKDYEGWDDFKRLFSIPELAMLGNVDFIRLKNCCDKRAPNAIREVIESFEALNKFNRKAAETYLLQTGYKYNLATLLGEVARNKVEKSNGIVTHWNQPESFFVNKTLSIVSPGPTGVVKHGIIDKCEKKGGRIHLFLTDGTEVLVDSQFKVKIGQTYTYKDILKALELHILRFDDFTISHSKENEAESGLPPGTYHLLNKKTVNSTSIWGGNLQVYFQYDLVYLSGGNMGTTYTLLIDNKGNKVTITKQQDGMEGLMVEVRLSKFGVGHLVQKKQWIDVPQINSQNADASLVIKTYIDEDRAKREHLEQIDKKMARLREDLRTAENGLLLERLLDNIVSHKLKSVDFILCESNQKIAGLVTEISRNYQDFLKLNYSPAIILHKAALEANYATIVKIEKNILIARTMELLNASKEHTNKISGKNIVLFVGSTGSGKSTSVAYFLGAPLKQTQNQVGDDVLYVEANPGDYPTIGQSLGTSETLYTQGYPMKDAPFLLADCPGFNDTRGGDYELCTNISIDQAVQKAHQILSIVLVFPVTVFLLDRGNPVVDLIETLKVRFPFAFDPNSEANSRVFILLTKTNQAKEDVVAGIKEGTRYEKLVEETTRELNGIKSRSDGEDSFDIRAVDRRLSIWKMLLHMHQQKRIDCIDVENLKARDDLLAMYTKDYPAIDKSSYRSTMANDYMHKKFGDSVQLAAAVWIEFIFDAYTKRIPDAIRSCQDALAVHEKDLARLQSERISRLSKIEKLGRDIKKLELLVEQLQAYELKPDDATLREELLATSAAEVKAVIDEKKGELAATKIKIKLSENECDSIQTAILEKQEELSNLEKTIEAEREKIEETGKGSSDVNLYKDTTKPDDRFRLFNYRPGTREERLKNVERVTNEDLEKNAYYNGLAKDYKGKICDLAIIDARYRLVPADTKDRQTFFTTGQGGGYIAKVSGLRHEIDMTPNADSEGKKVAYPYKLTFDGTDIMPYITIDHTIPNKEFKIAQIIDMEAVVGKKQAERDKLEEAIEDHKEAASKKIKEVNDLKSLEIALSDEIQRLENDEIKQIKDSEVKILVRLRSAKQEKQGLENFLVIDNEINEVKEKITKKTLEIERARKELRNIAIIVKMQWKSAELLREFADLICGPSDGVSETEDKHYLNETQERCRQFIKIFDQHKASFFKDVCNEHNLHS